MMKMDPEGWPEDFCWDERASEVLDAIDLAFEGVARPLHFTKVDHCCECREHDQELSVRTRMTLRRSDLGSSAWDPICFTSNQGIAYLFPVLARYCMAPSFWSEYDWYGTQLVFHLTYKGDDNRFHLSCSVVQRAAVAAMIEWLVENRSDEMDSYDSAGKWYEAVEIWRA